MPYTKPQIRAMMAKGGKSKQAARDYLRNEAPSGGKSTKKKSRRKTGKKGNRRKQRVY